MKRVCGIALVAVLAGCSRGGPPPSPPAPLPTLKRPVVTLDQPTPWRPSLQGARPGGEARNVRIPKDALTRLGGLPGVFVLDRDQDARFRLVKVGRIKRDHAEILSGLSGHETLVLGTLADVHDGSPISPEQHQ